MDVKERTDVFLTYDEGGHPCEPPKARYMAQVIALPNGRIGDVVKLYRFRARAWSQWDRQEFRNPVDTLDEAKDRVENYLTRVVEYKAEL